MSQENGVVGRPKGGQQMHVHVFEQKENNTSGSRVLQVEPLATCQTSADRIGSYRIRNDDPHKEPHDVSAGIRLQPRWSEDAWG